MAEFQYDLFVIGAGSGGVRAARMSSQLGAKTGIAEDRYLGGTCVNVGCVPKKLFVYASHFAEEFEIAKSFGWSLDNNGFNWRKLLENKNKEIKRLNGVYEGILSDAGVDIKTGHATLVDEHAVAINNETFTAEYILIATGGWPHVPEFPGHKHVITSNDAFFLDVLPENIIIVGGGYIAVEFAGIFHGMGVDTTLVYRGPLFMRGFDDEVRSILAEEMRKKGIHLYFDSTVSGITRKGENYCLELSNGSKLDTAMVMYATGRRPSTGNLGLENVPIELDTNGAIKVNQDYRSSVPSIYAIGDVTDRVNLTPVALAEGMCLANHLFNRNKTSISYDNIPTCVFSQPNLGTVGLTETEARKQCGELSIFKSTFKPMKLSLTDHNEKTFMKIIVEKESDKVVGVHMLGPDAGEIIQGVAIAIKAGATKEIFDSTIGIHPTAAEELVTMREPANT